MTKSLLLWSKWQLECTAMKDMKFTHSHRGHGTYFCVWVRIWFSVFVIDILVGAMTHHPAVKWQLRHCSVIIALRNFVLSSTLKSSRQKSSTISANIFDKLSKYCTLDQADSALPRPMRSLLILNDKWKKCLGQVLNGSACYVDFSRLLLRHRHLQFHNQWNLSEDPVFLTFLFVQPSSQSI